MEREMCIDTHKYIYIFMLKTRIVKCLDLGYMGVYCKIHSNLLCI